MSKKILKEFENDAAADTAVAGVTSSLTKLASAISNVKDFSRVLEAIAKWMQTKKDLNYQVLIVIQTIKEF